MGRFLPVLVCFVAISSVAGGCGSPDTESPAPPKADLEAAFAKAPAPLRAIYAQSNELLDGGAKAFEKRLRELRGYPVVVNKWGSWCPPCRRELPFFQRQAIKRARTVAFLGVDAIDPVPEAKALLEKIPLTFPSYKDEDLKVSAVFNGVASTPVTAFYDPRGELAYLKQGEYRSEQDLARDIERYGR